jgi:hypothetical protein
MAKPKKVLQWHLGIFLLQTFRNHVRILTIFSFEWHVYQINKMIPQSSHMKEHVSNG